MLIYPSVLAVAIASLFVVPPLLPWSFQLFLRWVFRGGDLDTIPAKFHAELNEMCYKAADENGVVKGREYSNNIEIAESLGTFHCKKVNGGQEWLIQDHKSFASADEAILGTGIAEFLVTILGTDYSYDIEARIPNLKDKPSSINLKTNSIEAPAIADRKNQKI
ncbi:hypothetical protein [Pannus brasiliensis]|uniref:hypothetical protein n=1 Tax=Pannus brasiliensis TaxID=1579216 RepID=UPI002FCDB4FC